MKYTNIATAATTVIDSTGTARFVGSVTCHNANAATRYVQLFDLAVVPTTTATVPTFCFLVPAGAQIIVGTDFFTNDGYKFIVGLTWAFSTTRDVYTAATASDQQTTIIYR